MVVENKIHSTESKGQLKKYRDFVEKEFSNYKHRIYLYLSLKEQNLSGDDSDYYIQITYNHIIKLLNTLLATQQISISEQTRFVLQQYLQTLKSMLNQNEEIETLTKELYKKYKAAFDLVFKYCATSESEELSSFLQELIESETSIVSFQSTKSYVRFKPKFIYDKVGVLKEKGIFPKDEDIDDDWIYLFEFNIRNNCINFDLKIGDGDSDIRSKILDIYQNNSHFFNKVNKKFSLKWHLSFQKEILRRDEFERFIETGNIEETKIIITRRFQELMEKIKEYEKIIFNELS